MTKTKIIFAISALMLASLACNALTPTSTPVVIVTEEEVPRVSLEQALTAYTAGAAIFVDVRGLEYYEMSHIPGALNIPLSEFENNIANVDLDQDAWIITYCT